VHSVRGITHRNGSCCSNTVAAREAAHRDGSDQPFNPKSFISASLKVGL
jgi:hypothetical protein